MVSKNNNNICKKILKEKELKKKFSRITVSFYKYFKINDPIIMREKIYFIFTKWKIFGRIYIATEGINAQINIPYMYFSKVKKFIYQLHSSLKSIHINIALDNNVLSFWMLKVKVRKKIVADGINITLNYQKKSGKYLKYKDINQVIHDSNTVFVDVRNEYEYSVGHFLGSIRIPGNTFKEQMKNSLSFLSPFKQKNIIMYCTGGIRCEKATSWIIFNGFKKVYHILGGIIRYVQDSRKKKSNVFFIGSNFVFDERMTEVVSKKIISHCYICGKISNSYKNCKNNLCHILIIQCDSCQKNYSSCCSTYCKSVLLRNI